MLVIPLVPKLLKSSEVRELVFSNILDILLTFPIFQPFTLSEVNALALLNIPYIFSTFLVSKPLKSSEVNALALLNIELMSVTDDVSH